MSETGAQDPRQAGPRNLRPIRPVLTAARAVWVFTVTTVQVCLLGSDAYL